MYEHHTETQPTALPLLALTHWPGNKTAFFSVSWMEPSVLGQVG